MSDNYFLTKENIYAIPDRMCPMIVLSDNIRSLFSWGIKVHTQGCYNHMMWLLPGGELATQNTFFTTQPVEDYLSNYRLKFWYCPTWTLVERERIIKRITLDLEKPFYKRSYDYLAILGQLFHLDWVQTPGVDICSDKASYLNILDNSYDLEHPDPGDVNRWLEENDRYLIYGRYVPD